ncbi:MAG: glutamyl-tRNA reductase [Halorhodospira halophila]|uniref:glutamyl-tRNA reductase n=1 Tax=Halorhodospira TaxID=85108 RepID=UPI00191471E5|nr:MULTISPECIES: glutamyl-tRNA reductase [Halorhodospira]MBK5943371.1 glutamyl-tRNA reductase [Halorhodospira halophila]MCC3751055.1 glutamyl-tRNA reductase [Halorhodospira halophila]MCG5526901.1 glutamyl-tRNA reductase [Halorhodospira halophila]MCG5533159.1 glutamyl-tRNA reductase [Halorhodospira sp. 9621]MCG5537913.1 glutamyl-tRNA reductase [Halorhodospira sp. 9622]
MPLFAIGLNHDSAPVAVRESLAFNAEALGDALQSARSETGADEVAILSTCNRTEIYIRLPHTDPEVVIGWLTRHQRVDLRKVRPHLYVRRSTEAMRHLMRVSAGLDSLVLGEPQILGQVKDAYHKAASAGCLGAVLERLFQHAFSVAKQVRTDTDIGSNPISVAFAAVTMAKQIFDDFPKRTAVLVGAGETIELVARHLAQQGIGQVLVANRNVERAKRLAEAHDGEAMSLNDLPRRLPEADVVVSSTGSSLPILGKGTVERAVRARRHKPMFMLDLAVPRDIEPEAGEMDDVYLYTVDDLRGVVAENMRSRQDAATQAEAIVEQQVRHYLEWRRARDAGEAIRSFRNRAESYARATRAQAARQLSRGEDPFEVIEWLTHTLTRRLVHAPTVGLRAAAASGDRTRIQHALETLAIDQQLVERSSEGDDSQQAGADGGTARGDRRAAGGS